MNHPEPGLNLSNKPCFSMYFASCASNADCLNQPNILNRKNVMTNPAWQKSWKPVSIVNNVPGSANLLGGKYSKV